MPPLTAAERSATHEQVVELEARLNLAHEEPWPSKRAREAFPEPPSPNGAQPLPDDEDALFLLLQVGIIQSDS